MESDMNPQCNENWHIFANGLPVEGDICNCGKKRAAAELGALVDV